MREYWDTKRRIATMIAGGATPVDAADAILREAAAAGGYARIWRGLHRCEKPSRLRTRAFWRTTRDLRELAGLNANVFANPEKKLLAETASRLQELQIIYASLRDDPDNDKVSRDIRKLIKNAGGPHVLEGMGLDHRLEHSQRPRVNGHRTLHRRAVSLSEAHSV